MMISDETLRFLGIEERLYALSCKIESFTHPPSIEESDEIHREIASLRDALAPYCLSV